MEELRFLVEKVLRMLAKLDLQEVPPLVYQLLLLSAKVCQHSEMQSSLAPFVCGPKCLSCPATFRVVRNRSWMESSVILRHKMFA